MHDNDTLRSAAVSAHSDATSALFHLMMAHAYGATDAAQHARKLLSDAVAALDAALTLQPAATV